jgi:photosystem II stability/assembly factor-like uncharacterized protein
MSAGKTVASLVLLSACCAAEWKRVSVPSSASLRGLSVVSGEVVWASGTTGTVLRTVDGGQNWIAWVVPGAERLDFRGVWAFDADTAYVMSSGAAEEGLARIYGTGNGGKDWRLAYEQHTPGVFFDAIAFWDRQHGMVLSDPVGGRFALFVTENGGANWSQIPAASLPAALPREGAFAASNSCLAVQGERSVWFGTGGADTARVFRSEDRGRTWSVSDTPMHPANASSGIFSLAFRDAKHGLAVGGDYAHPAAPPLPNVMETTDGGQTWLARKSPGVFLSSINYSPIAKTIVAAGSAGIHAAKPDLQWKPISGLNINALAYSKDGSGWAVGPQGAVFQFLPIEAK